MEWHKNIKKGTSRNIIGSELTSIKQSHINFFPWNDPKDAGPNYTYLSYKYSE